MKQNIFLFATNGQIEDTITEYYQKHNIILSFSEAIRSLYSNGLLTSTPKHTHIKNIGFLSDEEFVDVIRYIYVNVNSTLSQNETLIVTENNFLPENRNVLAFKAAPYKSLHIRSHDHFVINYVYSGKADLYFESKKYTLTAGQVAIIAPYSQHDILGSTDGILIRIIIRKSNLDSMFTNNLIHKNLLTVFFRNALFETNNPNYLFFSTDNNLQLKSIIQNLVYETNYYDNYSKPNSISWLSLLFSHLIRYYSNSASIYNYHSNLQINEDFTLILHYIQSNYQTVSLSTLAQIFNYSESYLGKLIKKNLHENYTTIIQKIRMEHAREYLIHTNYKIYEIAELTGYESVDCFSRSFKNYFHLAPSAYRLLKKAQ